MSDNNEIICNCMGVTRGDIIKVIKEKNLKTVDEIAEATEAGSGCGGCHPEIQEILDEVNA